MSLSPQRRHEIIDALRRGTVPRSSLDAFAVGLDRFDGTLDEELQKVKSGGSQFKAIRGEYGCGKTFFARWLADRARKLGFATSEVQISETETPLHRLETVYRRLMERLSTDDTPQGALHNIINGWFFALEEDVLAEGTVDSNDQQALVDRTTELLEQRLAVVSRSAGSRRSARCREHPCLVGRTAECGGGLEANRGSEGGHRPFRSVEFPSGGSDRIARFRTSRVAGRSG